MRIIKSQRQKLGITQDELARMIGVTQGAVTQWECGVTKPSITLLPKIAKVLNCTIDELLRTENE